MKELRIGSTVFGPGRRFVLIAGPCVIESEELVLSTASRLKDICGRLGLSFVFKSSFDKANRTSGSSFRGPGPDEGLRILEKVKKTLGVPILTDIHEPGQADAASQVADILQIPAFLMRQTDLLLAAGRTGKIVNIKKAQFASAPEVGQAAAKVAAVNDSILLTERGTMFGYHDLVVDFRNLEIMAGLGRPVVFDATHSVQSPGGGGTKTTGRREFIPVLCRAACAAGIQGLFMETHPDPDRGMSDAANMFPLDGMEHLLKGLVDIDDVVKSSR
jgi:2-dehydro-3-deoxyphosphooctonate aldolase (KDO 8-P synthase)